MKQKRFLGLLPAFCVVALPSLVQGQSLELGDATGEFNQSVEIPVTLTSDEQVQGLVVAAKWDPAIATGVDVTPGDVIDNGDPADEANADTVVVRLEDDFFVMGVVLDSDPNDNGGEPEVIAPGEDIQVATLTLQCGSGPDEGMSPVEFADGEFATVEGGPLLDNVIVVGGLSIGATEGLALDNGSISCIQAPDKFTAEDTEIEGSSAQDVRILMSNNSPVEGFVTSICHDGSTLTLNDISVGPDAQQADFNASEIDPANGGALGVVIDLEDPVADPPNIEPGSGQHIASYNYSCVEPLQQGDDPVPSDLTFCDGAIGDPLKDNLIVVGGMSITSEEGLVLENGVATCVAPDKPPSARETQCDDGIDNDADGLIDLEDPDCQEFDFEAVDEETLEPTSFIAGAGESTPVPLAYNAPTRADLGLDGDGGDVLVGDSPVVSTQGFSLGFAYDCAQVSAEATFDVSGTVLESLNAEFVGVQADNDPDDGDGCSLVVAVLVDALPPFDGAVIPGLAQPQLVGRLSLTILEDVPCGDTVLVEGSDGVNGNGKVPVRNLISVDNQPFPATVRPIELEAARAERFFRGDCNFTGRSGGLDPVEIADAAAVISFLFQKSIFKFDPPCLDACDANDDGRIDLADSIGILNYLFIPGANFPPAPGPGFAMNDAGGVDMTDPGGDPTPDPLDCVAGSSCDF